ncbi:hypothetical protein CMV_014794 [Castanea mollissima]|uniref:Uncharacterized protein n=1 Tax=Castanea mollissima TaxID=60419 RepID=A0A8J4QVM5_9ROSI|nr:hypothetical protein CMV_014794 [Castanea mollissima]
MAVKSLGSGMGNTHAIKEPDSRSRTPTSSNRRRFFSAILYRRNHPQSSASSKNFIRFLWAKSPEQRAAVDLDHGHPLLKRNILKNVLELTQEEQSYIKNM